MAGSGVRMVEVNGVELGVETFGHASDPVVLLIGKSMLAWPDETCAELACGSRFVVRFDPRDAGGSTSYPPGAPGYGLADLVGDAACLAELVASGPEPRAVHVVAASVGGWVGQLLALDHPERVASLTLISSRPTAPGVADPDLPDHEDRVMAHFMSGEPDWDDRASVVEHLTGLDRVLAGSLGEFDEQAARELAGRAFDRTTSIKSNLINLSFVDSGPRWRERLGDITAPTLVIHGTEDPFFPFGNALALAKEIPGAELLPLEGVGHEPTPVAWRTVTAAVLRHTAVPEAGA